MLTKANIILTPIKSFKNEIIKKEKNKCQRHIKINEEEGNKIKEIRKGIKDKRVNKRLQAVKLRGEKMKNSEIAKKLDTTRQTVSLWVSTYVNGGVEALYAKPGCANHCNMTYEEEFLALFREREEKRQLSETSEIKAAYIECIGHNIGRGQIYRALHPHGWRKVMPRSRHPKKADDEVIETSKELTQKQGIFFVV